MYELIRAGERTYYIDCPAKIGIYKTDDSRVCLIDSGNDKDTAKKVLKILDVNGWQLDRIISTHSHADHIGGCALLQQRTGAGVFCAGIDRLISIQPLLEPTYLYGGYPCRQLRNKFLMAAPCEVSELTPEALPEGLTMLRLDGHSFAMTAIKTDDEVWFLADALTGESIIEKYHVSFLYDPGAYIQSLKRVMELTGRLFVPAHAEAAEDIRPLAELNLNKTYELIELIKSACTPRIGFEDLLKHVFDRYGLAMNFNQHVLVGSTLRSYLSYLCDEGVLEPEFYENRLYWRCLSS